jgi:hypothetical protein
MIDDILFSPNGHKVYTNQREVNYRSHQPAVCCFSFFQVGFFFSFSVFSLRLLACHGHECFLGLSGIKFKSNQASWLVLVMHGCCLLGR